MSKKIEHWKLNSKAKSKFNSNWDDLTGEEVKQTFHGITDKQRSLMIKLGIKFTNTTTCKQASELISKKLNK